MTDFSVRKFTAPTQRTGCIVVGVFESRRLSDAAALLDKASGGRIARLLRASDTSGKPGETLLLNNPGGIAAERVVLAGCGPKGRVSPENYAKAAAAAMGAAAGSGARDASVCLTELEVEGRGIYWKVRRVVEELGEHTYAFDQLKSEKSSDGAKRLRRVVCAIPSQGQRRAAEDGVAHGSAIAAGVELAKDLGNLPGNVCTPSYLANRARQLARSYKTLTAQVKSEAEMKRLGMGALLSVARGSEEPAKLITLEYRGARAGTPPIALVGKGVTFDSGGISIKPAAAMDEMKFDMCGAASVLGAMKAVATLSLPINVVGVVPATENLPSGRASKPGDIYTSMSGQTVEVLNTDAEGRLILCDALSFAKRYKPETVVDIATLTGACVIALGNHAAGLFSNHAPLAKALLEAGEFAVDRAWELPMWEEYAEALKSNFADVANVGGREAGAITAASFLSRFAKEFRWAHLDIAGVAWRQGASKGATGRPVRLLCQYLIDRAGRARDR